MNTNTKNPQGLEKILAQRQAKINPQKKQPVTKNSIKLGRRIKSQALADFTRQLATLIGARLALTEALDILAQQNQKGRLSAVIRNIRQQVESGESLASALAQNRKIFGNLYISLVKVGEMAGVLPMTLNRLATYLERMSQVRRKFIMAMTYPAVIVFVAIGAVSFMLAFIVPTFADMFQDFGAQMPAATQMVINMGHFFKSYGLYLVGIFLIISYLIKQMTKEGKGKFIKDTFLLKIPLVSSFLKNSLIGRFCRTLGTLLESGVSLLEALEVTAGISGNVVFNQEVLEMKRHAIGGGLIAERLSSSVIFPAMVVQMIHVGEETAELDTMLHKIADYYDDALNSAIDTLASVIEPIIIVVLGVVLGGIIIAMYLQLFNLMNVMG